jgi:hypothetical protein
VQRLLLATAAFLVLYVGVIAVNSPTGGAEEVFPLYSWDLFSRVPPRDNLDYDLRLIALNGRKLETPLYFSEAGPFVAGSRSPEAALVIEKFGKALARHDRVAADHQQNLLDGRFLVNVKTVSYEIVRRRWNLLERSKCHCFEEEVVVGRFEHR